MGFAELARESQQSMGCCRGVGVRRLSRRRIDRHGGVPKRAETQGANPGSRRARFSDETSKLRRVIDHPR